MSNFEKAIPFILEHEGGLVDHPNDPGGLTNFGICKRSYPDLDIRNLTKEQAIEIYKRDYWKSYLDEIDFPISCKLFDASVNMGHKQANKLLQRAIWVEVDGKIGPKTISTIQSTKDIVNKFISELESFYTNLATTKPKFQVFLKGWLRRARWVPPEV